MNEIEKWYDNEYDEWSRLERHIVEFEVTKRYLDAWITRPGSRIFDIGGGPGRYAIELAKKGHEVTLLDLSGKNIRVAEEKSAEAGVSLKACVKGNALELSGYEKESFDVILLMGPLYHLLKREEREQALKGALELLKKDGLLFASFISQYAPIQDCLSYFSLEGSDGVQSLLRYLSHGENQPDAGFTSAYFTSVEEARQMMESHNLEELVFAGVENILGCKERELLECPEPERSQWLELAYALAEDEKCYGVSQHFLYIGKRK